MALTQNPFTRHRSAEAGAAKLREQQDDSMLSDLFDDDGDTEELAHLAPVDSSAIEGNDSTLAEISASMKLYHEKFTGVMRSRFVTAQILLRAPEGYLALSPEVKRGTKYVRDTMVDQDQLAAVTDAQENPTDHALQDRAYKKVYGIVAEYMSKSLYTSRVERQMVMSFICNEILGLGVIDALWRDRSIDEIMCNGPHDIQVEIRGEVYKVRSIGFADRAHLSELISRLYKGIGKTLAPTTPLLKGRLHDRSRMFATHESIAPDGPNFQIRRHPEGFWTPADIVRTGSSSEEMMTFIGNLVYKGASFIVSGGTSTGKTSMLNALTGFYKPQVRILTLEDNLEMKPNPKKYLASPMETRPPSPDRQNDNGVTMRDLVKASLQMRPDVLIIGEVTDSAAYDLCQALNTGHSGASTFHANSSQLSVTRVASLVAQSGLTTVEGGMELVSAAFDFIISLKHFPRDGSRRIVSIDEVGTKTKLVDGVLTLETHPLWVFHADESLDGGKITGHWEQVGEISQGRREAKLLDIDRDLTWEELVELSSLPDNLEKVNR